MYELRYTRCELQSQAPAAQCCKAAPALTQNACAASQTLNSYLVIRKFQFTGLVHLSTAICNSAKN